MKIRYANKDDIPAIRSIYNAGIESGTGTFETRLRRNKDIAEWLKVDNLYPLLVAESDEQVIGFARLYQYRPRECYAGIAEFSIYLADGAGGKGTGTLLLGELLTAAGVWGFHKVISRIFTTNHASRALCQKLGFREVGIYEKHGQINGHWLDVVIVEYLTNTTPEKTGSSRQV